MESQLTLSVQNYALLKPHLNNVQYKDYGMGSGVEGKGGGGGAGDIFSRNFDSCSTHFKY